MHAPSRRPLRTRLAGVSPLFLVVALVGCGPKAPEPTGDGRATAEAVLAAIEDPSVDVLIPLMTFSRSNPEDASLQKALGAAIRRAEGLDFQLKDTPPKRSNATSRTWGVDIMARGGEASLGEASLALAWTAQGWRATEDTIKPLIDAGGRVLRRIARANMRARVQMANLGGSIEMYRMQKRALPESLEILTEPDARTGEAFIGSIPQDPWGQAYLFEPKEGDTWALRSVGADGTQGTDDDIVHTPREG